jgi:SHS2 domain-containing protein
MHRYTRPAPWEELDHTADAGVIVHGDSPEQALARLVLAFAELVSGGGEVREERELSLEVEAGDRAAMAVDVLRELLYRFDAEGAIPASCEIRDFDPARGARLGVGVGPYDPALHAEGIELKAVTLHEARFEREGEGWTAQIVFDI